MKRATWRPTARRVSLSRPAWLAMRPIKGALPLTVFFSHHSTRASASSACCRNLFALDMEIPLEMTETDTARRELLQKLLTDEMVRQASHSDAKNKS
jgi:hypothetical protein